LEVLSDGHLRADPEAKLAAFCSVISARTGQDSYEATSGAHDDLVMALGVAIWTASQGRWNRPGKARDSIR
jgi:hypothetical protein